MKTTELKQIIKEEVKNILKEIVHYDPRKYEYDLKNLGGGWDGKVFLQCDFKELRIDVCLYSGGSRGVNTYKVSENLKNAIHDQYNNQESYEIVAKFQENVAKELNSLLKKFDTDFKKVLDAAVNKYNK